MSKKRKVNKLLTPEMFDHVHVYKQSEPGLMSVYYFVSRNRGTNGFPKYKWLKRTKKWGFVGNIGPASLEHIFGNAVDISINDKYSDLDVKDAFKKILDECPQRVEAKKKTYSPESCGFDFNAALRKI